MSTVQRSTSSPWFALSLSLFLGWQDIRMMYRRSVLGQFWITLSMAVTFVAIGLVFGLIFKSPVVEYMPFLGCGLVFFTFMGAVLNDGATSFIMQESFLKQLPLPPVIFYLRTMWKAVFSLLHNGVALIALFVVFPQGVSPATFLVIPGFLIVLVGIGGLGLAVAMLATRYRDIPQIVVAAVQVCFYLTPVLWQPNSLPPEAQSWVLTWNPFYHFLEVTRLPLLNEYPSGGDWLAASAFALAFVAIGAGTYVAKYRRLAFWL